jgi:Flp pilus assembly protein TadD
VLFVLGLMSKTVTATLPAALLVVFWWQRGRLSWRRDVLPLVPFFVFGALGGVVTAYFERTLIGATGEEFDLSLIGRVLLAGRVIWFYLGKLIWPTNLMFWYPRWTIDPAQFSHWLYPLAAIGATIGLWAIRGRWRAPLGAWLFFVGTLSPVLGFLNVYPFRFSYVADHFQYLACLGPIVLAAAGITLGIARLPLPVRPVANAVAVALAAGLTLLTWFQSAVYADPVTLYEDTLAKNPDCWAAHNNLGEVLKNQTPRAAEHFRRALELKPNYAEAHNNLGTTLLETGQTDAAIKQFVAAIELRRDVPDWYINLANALTIAGRAPEAIPILEHVVQVAPEFAEAENNLADALLAVGRPQEAIAHAEKALQLEPSWPEPRSIIGNALLNMNRPQEAAVRLNEAVRINPEFLAAWANLGVAYALSNQRDDAVAAIGRAMDLARANGRSASVQQLQRRLDAYRAGILNFRDQPPSAAQPSPASENSKSPPSP